ncbi:MAG: hypothetical protein BGO12_02960 [Verrucomicrobia bacterium 61-8]|nr:PBP1A family penicillin-binding protein [Verrucomicrobiota bacterium]OJV00805.1 MAG: hypothetical protein BGO12_02960 [Verrucomicrobia bacterium 61-8]
MSKSRRPSKKAPAKKKKGCLGGLFWLGVKLGVLLLLVAAVILLGYYAWALTFDLRTISDMRQRSAVYDKDGKFYSRLAGENRIVVPFDKISNDFVNALLAREDTRFYYHHGIDPLGITRAVVRNFLGGFRLKEGASTLTQQLARNSFPLGGKNFHRKMIEAALSYRIETELTKEQILEAYMNRIYFGSGYYGVETASQAYFGKPASRMTVAEAALLAGLIRSPNRFSPFNNPEKAVRERNTVLGRMLKLGYIDQTQYRSALDSKLTTGPRPRSAPQENWAMDAIVRDLQLVIDQDQLDEGGLKIYTTIDSELQKVAEDSVKKRLKEIEKDSAFRHKPFRPLTNDEIANLAASPFLQAAALAVDNRSGGIRAIVGGRDYEYSKFNRALLGKRQVGSSIKPFVYAKAFEAGLRPGDPINDNRLGPGDLPAAFRKYDPSNSDDTYRGLLPAADGLVLSRNTMSVRIGRIAGFDTIADCIIRAGISSNPPRYPSLCLGAFEANLKDMTAAYTVFATGGAKLQPYLIDRIVDADNTVIYRATKASIPVLPEQPARMTASIMEDVLIRGTAARSRALGLRHRAAGKTGTTNDYQDAWFLGFDDRITCGVWVGFDVPEKIMPGGTGAELALPIWVDIVEGNR